ncbi:zinc finger FYVE domain-containing protein 26-like [Elysia marginata]|uniref:Zinc finger FYVE domain-containing protein 26-like n=1 Tax=Elysia marginata TaxID=1093978 RepID=A0AAV4F9K7_9GAST|nr:zinc finger FYVE domain-containing protein 26-like [Elysia marginata]
MASSCRSLAYHLDLMQWCLDRAKPLLEGSDLNPSRQATQLLQGLETHSVLYMLHHSTSLAQLDHAEVLQLLNNLSVEKSIYFLFLTLKH